jgi:hypothetical protein
MYQRISFISEKNFLTQKQDTDTITKLERLPDAHTVELNTTLSTCSRNHKQREKWDVH